MIEMLFEKKMTTNTFEEVATDTRKTDMFKGMSIIVNNDDFELAKFTVLESKIDYADCKFIPPMDINSELYIRPSGKISLHNANLSVYPEDLEMAFSLLVQQESDGFQNIYEIKILGGNLSGKIRKLSSAKLESKKEEIMQERFLGYSIVFDNFLSTVIPAADISSWKEVGPISGELIIVDFSSIDSFRVTEDNKLCYFSNTEGNVHIDISVDISVKTSSRSNKNIYKNFKIVVRKGIVTNVEPLPDTEKPDQEVADYVIDRSPGTSDEVIEVFKLTLKAKGTSFIDTAVTKHNRHLINITINASSPYETNGILSIIASDIVERIKKMRSEQANEIESGEKN